ncbi:putative membrane protein YhiD involved in acid resistance [Pseudorhizobium tarimense]|uniref:Membrane protein YhiD involved in acid resistance n=1 Tax=Pseudorhizobium tarimense TaxID=1079109 RepID=A0ABV2H072_9HYPH
MDRLRIWMAAAGGLIIDTGLAWIAHGTSVIVCRRPTS